MSIGGAMNAWLTDTLEAAELLTMTMERARAAPGLVIRELNSYALSLSEENSAIMEKLRRKGSEDRAKGASRPPPRRLNPNPPPCNTGGKLLKSIQENPDGVVL